MKYGNSPGVQGVYFIAALLKEEYHVDTEEYFRRT